MRNKVISIFVVVWLVLFLYESMLFFMPQWQGIKFLFPPRGWIMFFRVDDGYGFAEVYGLKEGRPQLLDPHQILQTRAIGYNNICRNALVNILEPGMAARVCPFLKRKFPYFDGFWVTYSNLPSVTGRPFEKQQVLVYECP